MLPMLHYPLKNFNFIAVAFPHFYFNDLAFPHFGNQKLIAATPCQSFFITKDQTLILSINVSCFDIIPFHYWIFPNTLLSNETISFISDSSVLARISFILDSVFSLQPLLLGSSCG
jgi:hypothetical protein